MLDGSMPYGDIFDHKGPVLYLLEVLGAFVNREWGILLIEISVILGSVFLWRATLSNLGFSPFQRVVSIVIALCFVA